MDDFRRFAVLANISNTVGVARLDLRRFLMLVALGLMFVIGPRSVEAWDQSRCAPGGAPQGQCTGPEPIPGAWQYGHCWAALACADTWEVTDCRASGGTPVPPQGAACGWTCDYSFPFSWTSENQAPLLRESLRLKYSNGLCPGYVNPTPWGTDYPGGTLCSSKPLPGVVYQLGVRVYERRHADAFGYRLNSNNQCSIPEGISLSMGRGRSLALRCPPGYQQIPGQQGCVRQADDTCPVGNPVSIATGAKLHAETDLDLGTDGGIRIQRYYNSGGYFRPWSDSGARSFLGGYWRASFDARVYPLPGNQKVFAIAHRADGRVIQFDLSGVELEKVNGRPTYRISNHTFELGQQGYRIQTGDDAVELYDSQGRLVQVTNREGRTTTISWGNSALPDAPPVSLRDDRGLQVNIFGPMPIQAPWVDSGQRRYEVTLTGSPGNAPWKLIYDIDPTHGLSAVYRYDQSSTNPVEWTSYSYRPDGDFRGLLTGVGHYRGFGLSSTPIHGSGYTYDDAGRVTSSQSGNRTFAYEYSANGATVTDPLGTARTYTTVLQSGATRITGVSQPCPSCGAGNAQSREYDSNGFLSASIDYRGVRTEYLHDSRGRLLRKIEAASCPASVPRCAESRRVTEEDWHANFSVATETRVKDRNGVLQKLTRRSVNDRGQIVATCDVDPNGSKAATSYVCGSATNAPVGVRQTRRSYCEASDLLVPGTTCPTIGLLRTIDGPRTDVSDLTTYEYRPEDFNQAQCLANPSPINCPCSFQPTQCVYRRGDLWKITNPLGHVTTIASTNLGGEPKDVLDANGVGTRLVYDERRRLVSRVEGIVAGGSGATTSYAYDGLGRLTRTTGPDGSYLEYSYNWEGFLSRVVDNAGNFVEIRTDNAGNRLIEKRGGLIEALTYRIAREYDALGRLLRERDALDANGNPLTPISSNDDNAMGRLTSTLAHDPNGNVTSRVDARGRLTEMQYDAIGRVFLTVDALRPNCGLDPHCGRTRQEHDALDRIVAVTDPKGLTTSYTYDGLGNQVRQVSPDTGVTEYGNSTQPGHDAAGNVIHAMDARGVVSLRSYDGLGRVALVQYPQQPASNQSFVYDAPDAGCPAGERYSVGRLARSVSSAGSTVYCHDARGNIVRRIETPVWPSLDGSPVTGPAIVTRWQFDSSNRVIGVTYPSGLFVEFQRNSRGQVSQIRYRLPGQSVSNSLLSSISYLPFGPISQITYANGLTMQRPHDRNYRIDAITSTVGLSVDYTFDAAGLMTGFTSTGAPSVARAFEYDPLDRLTVVRDGANSLLESFSYDATGNRMEKRVGPQAQTYEYPVDSHRLTRVGPETRDYDPSGNMILQSRPQNQTVLGAPGLEAKAGAVVRGTFEYDSRNRLVRYLRGCIGLPCMLGGFEAVYGHNNEGARLWKATNLYPGTQRNVTMFAYDGWALLGEYDTVGAAEREYIWLDGAPVGIVKYGATTPVVSHVQFDHLGTPRVVVDPARSASVWRWDLSGGAFGDSPPITDADGDGVAMTFGLRYPGQHFDAETGLHYNYFRDYEPQSGRYLQSDPVGLAGGINTYAYVGSAPTHYVDPKGLSRERVRNIPCDSEESDRCRAYCQSMGRTMESCMRVEKFKIVRFTRGVGVWNWVKINESCSCNESFCERNPTTCTVGLGALILGICLTPWPDDVVIPALIGVAAAGG